MQTHLIILSIRGCTLRYANLSSPGLVHNSEKNRGCTQTLCAKKPPFVSVSLNDLILLSRNCRPESIPRLYQSGLRSGRNRIKLFHCTSITLHLVIPRQQLELIEWWRHRRRNLIRKALLVFGPSPRGRQVFTENDGRLRNVKLVCGGKLSYERFRDTNSSVSGKAQKGKCYILKGFSLLDAVYEKLFQREIRVSLPRNAIY